MKLSLIAAALVAAVASTSNVYAHEDAPAASPAASGAAPSGHAAAPAHSHGHDETDAIGVAGKPERVTRTVTVTMSDRMAFEPAAVNVKQGETIRFVIKNPGQLKHEFMLGTEAELKEHYALMLKFPEMEHADANAVTVLPGKTGEVVWQFTKAGKVDFACLQPGHYEAGMKGAVTVAASKGKADGHDDHHH